MFGGLEPQFSDINDKQMDEIMVGDCTGSKRFWKEAFLTCR
jgi:hypothetical protein